MVIKNKLSEKIMLELLKNFSSDNGVTSLAKKLHVSRVGIWKALKKLEERELVVIKKIGDGKTSVNPQHIRIFRRKTGLWVEAISRDKDDTAINQRKILGPVELIDGDTLEIADVVIKFGIKDAC